MKMLQSSFTRVLTASARSCWSGKFAQSDAGQPPTGPIFAHRLYATHHPLGFSPDFPRYLQQLHASVNTYLAIQVGNPKEAGDAMLVFFSVSLSLSLFWPKTFLWLRHIKAKKYRMSFVCLSFSPFFTLSIFAWAQLTRFCYYFDCETINFCDKRPLMAWRQSFAIFSQFAATTTICV